MHHLSLSDLNSIIKDALYGNLEPSYWVVAEISELRVNQKGHCYLELIEKREDRLIAKARATIWAYHFRNLSTWFASMTGQKLSTGMKILANVQVQFHELYGFSLNIRDIDPNYTLGEKERKKQEVIDRLIEDGVWDMNRSLKLPLVPQNIAVISSPTAAGYEDFTKQLRQNPFNYQFRVQFFKAVMQGEEATGSIINALMRVHNLSDKFDVIAIIRGGGSQVDFDCFNNYELTSHIAQFPLPIITGIGHERDETVTDLVAHTKMKTPTAVAEFIISGMNTFENRLINALEYLSKASRDKIHYQKNYLKELNYRIVTNSKDLLNTKQRKLDGLIEKLNNQSKQFINNINTRLDMYENSIRLLDPKNILKRGYTLTTVNNKLLKNYKGIRKGDKLKTEANNITVHSTIDDFETKK